MERIIKRFCSRTNIPSLYETDETKVESLSTLAVDDRVPSLIIELGERNISTSKANDVSDEIINGLDKINNKDNINNTNLY
jgi:hypothetical protein